jgi:cytoskeletal protein CcmA (bactofilin family)
MDDKLTVVDAAGTIQGKLGGRDARILGKFEGEIELTGRLHVGEGARVDGKVKVDTAEIGGEYKGELSARSVLLLEKARVEGALTTEMLAVREGAQLNASVTCVGARTTKTAPAPAPGAKLGAA